MSNPRATGPSAFDLSVTGLSAIGLNATDPSAPRPTAAPGRIHADRFRSRQAGSDPGPPFPI
ncbi:hypothetical protein [Streptomyces broussonetiae]|uniref:Uncharacterized protein n=1 Tax=Streptomyces broussonetiae TaxID=2686304 RepID=A0A6I6NDY9_9ACTN|nr:hypothetical protein [Streptomyces broussonetiae]QHA07135.1 hypothetical protein GQF42_30970 [Streptomyces broussonetiae]